MTDREYLDEEHDGRREQCQRKVEQIDESHRHERRLRIEDVIRRRQHERHKAQQRNLNNKILYIAHMCSTVKTL